MLHIRRCKKISSERNFAIKMVFISGETTEVLETSVVCLMSTWMELGTTMMSPKTMKKRSLYLAGGVALLLITLAIGMAAYDEKSGLPSKPTLMLDYKGIQNLIEQKSRLK